MGIAFTTEAGLIAAMGRGQRWIELSASALRTMPLPLGIRVTRIDPAMVGPELPSAMSRSDPRTPVPAGRR